MRRSCATVLSASTRFTYFYNGDEGDFVIVDIGPTTIDPPQDGFAVANIIISPLRDADRGKQKARRLFD
jgi:hypothetical protein